jgi:hypothetical protein
MKKHTENFERAMELLKDVATKNYDGKYHLTMSQYETYRKYYVYTDVCYIDITVYAGPQDELKPNIITEVKVTIPLDGGDDIIEHILNYKQTKLVHEFIKALDFKQVKIINCTGVPIKVHVGDKIVCYPASEIIAKTNNTTFTEYVDGVRLTHVCTTGVTGLPEQAVHTMLIVGNDVANAECDRTDLLIPSGGESINGDYIYDSLIHNTYLYPFRFTVTD